MARDDVKIIEWLYYMPLLIDYDNIDDFLVWFKDKIEQFVFDELYDKIQKRKHDAWIDHFHTIDVMYFKGKINNIDFDIEFKFRLRTLCIDIKCWWYSDDGIHISNAVEKINIVENELKEYKDKWGEHIVINKTFVIKPYYDKLSEIISNTDFKFSKLLPIECPLKCSYTLSSSKLIERNEASPFLVGNIRDNKGILINTILLCNEKERISELPCSYSRTRWIYFTNLIRHVIGRMNQQLDSIKNSLPYLEEDIHKHFKELSTGEEINKSLEKIESIVNINNKIASYEEQLSLILDDFLGVKNNLDLIQFSVDTSEASFEKVIDNPLYGNSYDINEIKSGIRLGIMGYGHYNENKIKCLNNYNCLLCDTKGNLDILSTELPLKYGAVDEIYAQIKSAIGVYRKNIQETNRFIDRIKEFFSNTLETIILKTNLNLTHSLLETTSSQTNLLTKMESVITESEITRKLSQKNTRIIELTSLVFASFVIGEISSNFIIGWLQQSSMQYPFHVYISGFILTLIISLLIFFILYFSFLKKE